MYQPTSNAIGMVAAIVNVPQELPGTSRLAPSGRVNPERWAFPLMKELWGTARLNGSWKTMVWFGPSPNR